MGCTPEFSHLRGMKASINYLILIPNLILNLCPTTGWGAGSKLAAYDKDPVETRKTPKAGRHRCSRGEAIGE